MAESSKSDLKSGILELCDYCENLFESDHTRLFYIQAAKVYLGNYDETKLMLRVIEKMSPHWDKVIRKDESFFVKESDKIFAELPINIDLFSSLFNKNGKNVLSSKEKDRIWSHFHDIIKYSCLFIHHMRDPVPIYDENLKLIGGKYATQYMNDIILKPYVHSLKFKLKFTN
jgi:hypothetical protein